MSPPATKRDLDAYAAATKRDLDVHAAATKRDLEVFEQRLRGELHEAIGAAMTSQTRTILFGLIGSNLTSVALGSAVASIR